MATFGAPKDLESRPPKAPTLNDWGHEEDESERVKAKPSFRSPAKYWRRGGLGSLNTLQHERAPKQTNSADNIQYHSEYEYSSPTVLVHVGLPPVPFLIHQSVLLQSAVLTQASGKLQKMDALPLPFVHPRHFEVVMRYLYTGHYQPRFGGEEDASSKFGTHAEIYCLASQYELHELALLTKSKLEISDNIAFEKLVHVAKVIYPKLPCTDSWFAKYFEAQASRAIMENPLLAEEPWILSIYNSGGGKLAADLFKAIVTTLVSKRSANDEESSELVASLDQNIESNDLKCRDRTSHLESLKKNGPWESCQQCASERKRIVTTGHAIISVAFHDLLPAVYSGMDLDIEANHTSKSAFKAMKDELEKEMGQVANSLPIVPITSDVLGTCNDRPSRHCPNQEEHLQRKGGKWGWENCVWCLNDRVQLFEKLQESNSSQHLENLAELKKNWQRRREKLRNPKERPGVFKTPGDSSADGKFEPIELSFPAVNVPNDSMPPTSEKLLGKFKETLQRKKPFLPSEEAELRLETDKASILSFGSRESVMDELESFSMDDLPTGSVIPADFLPPSPLDTPASDHQTHEIPEQSQENINKQNTPRFHHEWDRISTKATTGSKSSISSSTGSFEEIHPTKQGCIKPDQHPAATSNTPQSKSSPSPKDLLESLELKTPTPKDIFFTQQPIEPETTPTPINSNTTKDAREKSKMEKDRNVEKFEPKSISQGTAGTGNSKNGEGHDPSVDADIEAAVTLSQFLPNDSWD